jgi:phosphopantothenoylcysteine synthetase/decarboxylase
LKKHLLQVFLAAMYYNASATLKYMEMRNVTKDVILEIFKLKKDFRSSYEHKCFVIGITHMIAVFDAPESIKKPATATRLLQEILAMLEKVKKKEAKDALKKGNKQIQNDGDDDDDSELSDDDSDSEDEDDASDDALEAHTQFEQMDGAKGKRSRSNSNSMS